MSLGTNRWRWRKDLAFPLDADRKIKNQSTADSPAGLCGASSLIDKKPLISVIIPTFNRAELVVAAIASILAQSYPRLEVIVVDDGSTDGTADAIRSFTRDSSSRSSNAPDIHYLYQPNMGQSHARNTGIAAARGDWIAFVDSDDHWLPDKIDLQFRALEQFKNECGACICDAHLVNKSNNMDTSAFRLGGKRYRKFMGILSNSTADLASSVDGWWIQALVIRSDLAKQIGGFDADLHFMEDRDFLFRLSLVTSFCYINLPLAVIDRTSTATDPKARVRAWDSIEFRLGAQQRMYEKWLNLDGDFPLSVRTTIVQKLRAVHSAWANLYLQLEQFDLARKAVATAISYELTPGLAVKSMLTRIAPRIAKKIASTMR